MPDCGPGRPAAATESAEALEGTADEGRKRPSGWQQFNTSGQTEHILSWAQPVVLSVSKHEWWVDGVGVWIAFSLLSRAARLHGLRPHPVEHGQNAHPQCSSSSDRRRQRPYAKYDSSWYVWWVFCGNSRGRINVFLGNYAHKTSRMSDIGHQY